MLQSEEKTLVSLRNLSLAGFEPSVTINMDALSVYAEELKKGKKEFLHWRFPCVHPEDNPAFAAGALVSTAVNFHFPITDNPKEKFTVLNSAGKDFAGSIAMEHCFWRVLGETRVTARELWPFFRTLQNTREFFKGANQIPLLEHRHWIMQEVLTVLDERFFGDPMCVYEEARWDAEQLVQLLASAFPQAFGEDISRFMLEIPDGGEWHDDPSHFPLEFPFYKKAKLVCVLYQGRALDSAQTGGVLRPLSGMHHITAVEDYQVPRALQHKGVLVYSEKLLEKIKNHEIIRRHGIDELCIRGKTLEANKGIFDVLNKGLEPDDLRYWSINELDGAEWFGSRRCPLPHQITPGTAY
ncbi:MAG: hypothetical protein HYW88_02995 [Candidatus Sungbacteria bacterium]|nr:hypothetical protein [Candidatus Sungbacteria bacterium]